MRKSSQLMSGPAGGIKKSINLSISKSNKSATTVYQLVRSLMNMLDATMGVLLEKDSFEAFPAKNVPSLLECFFYFASIWTFGATCSREGRPLMNVLYRELMQVNSRG